MKNHKSPDWLHEKYVVEGLSQSEISDLCGVGRGAVGYNLRKYGIPNSDKYECSSCGEEYISIGHHWKKSDECDYPKISERQKEIITGLLMSDGNIQCQGNRNPTFRCSMVESSRPYLEYLDSVVLGELGCGVKDSHIDGVCRFYTHSHPDLEEFHDWYSSGKKVWPYEEIELTPVVMKHWYVGDGTYNTTNSHRYVSISAVNEYARVEQLEEMISAIGMEFNIHKGEYDGQKHLNIQFNKESTERLFDYMGEPLPSFEYKWPVGLQ